VQLHFAKNAAGLFIVQNVLQADDLIGQVRDILLRLIYDQ